MRTRAGRRVDIQMNLRSVPLVVAGVLLLTLAACQTPIYDDPPKVRFNPAYMETTPPPGVYGAPDRVTPTDVPPPPPPPVPRSQTTQLPSAEAGAPRDYPVGTPVTGKPGFVTSPYKPYAGYVDVRGFSPGEQVKDPYSGKIFLVP